MSRIPGKLENMAPIQIEQMIRFGADGPGFRDVKPQFGSPTSEEKGSDAMNREQPARTFIMEHRSDIRKAAALYGIDELGLANILYQENRHKTPEDDWQNLGLWRITDKTTLGPGQISIKGFRDLVDNGRVHLSDEEKREYKANPFEFSKRYLINEETGIKATAAVMADNVRDMARNNPNIVRDNDPKTLDLGQFVFGAGLHSKSGLSGDKEFDRKGPYTGEIDLSRNNISGLKDIPNGGAITNALRYLPETYEALYGIAAPSRLDQYFKAPVQNRGNRADAQDGDGRDVLVAGNANLNRQFAQAMQQIGNSDDASKRDTAALAVLTIAQTPGYRPEADIHLMPGRHGGLIVSQGHDSTAINRLVPEAGAGSFELAASKLQQLAITEPNRLAAVPTETQRINSPTMS